MLDYLSLLTAGTLDHYVIAYVIEGQGSFFAKCPKN